MRFTSFSFEDLKRPPSSPCTTDSKMDQPTHAQTPLGVKPLPASAALRPGSAKAAIRSSVFGPEHDRLPPLAKLHILANDSSFDSVISWTDDGKSFAINRVEYQRRIMNVFFEQNKFKSFQNMLSRYRFKTVRTINGGTAQENIIYSHPLFTRGYLDIVAIMKLTAKGVATAQSSKMIAKRSETRLHDKTLIISSHGAAQGQLQVLGAEIDDLAAIEPVPTNTVFENKFDSDGTLADFQWLPLFHILDIDVTDTVLEDNIDYGMMWPV